MNDGNLTGTSYEFTTIPNMVYKPFEYDSTKTFDYELKQEPKFELYQLVNENSKILKTKVKDNFDFGDPNLDPIEIASRLVETAKFHNSFGVAANQFGLNHRLFVVGSGDDYVAFFNPEIITYSDDTCILPEIDLSNMGLMLNIKRPKSIVISYQDYNGETKLVKFEGLTARIIQFCYDRLNGIDFKSKVSNFNLKRKEKALKKKVKQYIRSNMIISNK